MLFTVIISWLFMVMSCFTGGKKPYERFEEVLRVKQPVKVLIPITKFINWFKSKKKKEVVESKTYALWDRWKFK